MVSFPVKQGLFKYDVMDNHAILGSPLDATSAQIRQSYLKIAYLLHPDTTKAETEADRELASKIFSKLVNPAYEVLSRDQDRTEHLLIASQTARNLTDDRQLIVQSNADTQKLWAAKNNSELVYRQLMTALGKDLYADLSQVFKKIAQVSELNVVFLLLKSESPTRVIAQAQTAVAESTRPAINSTVVQAETPAPKLSPVETYLQRAREYFDKQLYSQAIAELREVLKLNPKESQAHTLLGLSYLKSNMITMAKVHIKTAAELDPQNPQLILAKRELAKHTSSGTDKSTNKDKKGGFLGGFFGGKKKS